MTSDKQEFIDGQFVSQRIAQIIEAIRDYSPELQVHWIPPNARDEGDAAFRIMHFPPGQEPYIIKYVQTEDEFTTAVFKDLIAGDQRNGKRHYSEIEAAEEAARRVAFQKWQDQRDEAIDIMHHVFNSRKNTYVVNKDLVIKDGIPFNAKGL